MLLNAKYHCVIIPLYIFPFYSCLVEGCLCHLFARNATPQWKKESHIKVLRDNGSFGDAPISLPAVELVMWSLSRAAEQVELVLLLPLIVPLPRLREARTTQSRIILSLSNSRASHSMALI